MIKLFIITAFVFCMCSCSKVKKEPVRVIPSSDAFVIQVDKNGSYFVYIPNESYRLQYNHLIASNLAAQDSVSEIQLSDLENAIAIYKNVIKDKDLNIQIEADQNVKYNKIKGLMKCLQDAGYTHWNLITKH